MDILKRNLAPVTDEADKLFFTEAFTFQVLDPAVIVVFR